jgi:hypothetical protein
MSTGGKHDQTACGIREFYSTDVDSVDLLSSFVFPMSWQFHSTLSLSRIHKASRVCEHNQLYHQNGW